MWNQAIDQIVNMGEDGGMNDFFEKHKVCLDEDYDVHKIWLIIDNIYVKSRLVIISFA